MTADAFASRTITKDAANSFALAASLRASDLAGAKLFPKTFEEGIHQRGTEASPLKCGDAMAIGHPVGGKKVELSYKHWLVGSVVLVMRSERIAKAAQTILASSRGRACLVRSLGEAETVEGEKTETSSATNATFVHVPSELGAGAIAVDVVATLHSEGSRAHAGTEHPSQPGGSSIYVDAAVFRVGPAEILLLSFGGDRPFPVATEDRLLSVLDSRAHAHRL
ncbi:MAG: hypothetical protein ACYDA6_10775 [Solirubrobacteraceae bacterium]